MTIKTNQELIQFVKRAIKESGIKKTVLAENIGLSRQGLDNLLKKKSFSLDDANRILNLIFLSAEIKIDLSEGISCIFVPDKIKELVEK